MSLRVTTMKEPASSESESEAPTSKVPVVAEESPAKPGARKRRRAVSAGIIAPNQAEIGPV
jgi:hypothetical protein